MKYANNVSIRTFCPPEEDFDSNKKIFLKVVNLTQEEIEKEKIDYTEKNAKGFSERTIKIINMNLRKDRNINKFLKQLNTILMNRDKKMILNEKNRLDDDLNFFIRLDKKALLENKYHVTNKGDCIHIKINIAAFPRTKEAAWAKIREIVREI